MKAGAFHTVQEALSKFTSITQDTLSTGNVLYYKNFKRGGHRRIHFLALEVNTEVIMVIGHSGYRPYQPVGQQSRSY